MRTTCKKPHHTFTVHSTDIFLSPYVDLVPGRRCLCGTHVIIDHPRDGLHPDLLPIACIDSPAAAIFAANHPDLKTW